MAILIAARTAPDSCGSETARPTIHATVGTISAIAMPSMTTSRRDGRAPAIPGARGSSLQRQPVEGAARTRAGVARTLRLHEDRCVRAS